MVKPPICEVCGQPASCLVLDTVVIQPPTKDEKGRFWPNSSAKGGIHARCATHPFYQRTEESEAYKQWLKEQRG